MVDINKWALCSNYMKDHLSGLDGGGEENE